MAKVRYYPVMPDDLTVIKALGMFRDGDSYIDHMGKKSVVVSLLDSDLHVVLHGKNFTQKQGELTGGRLDGFSLRDGDETLFTITNAEPVNIPRTDIGMATAHAFLRLMKNDDRIAGSRNDDVIWAEGGSDSVQARNGNDIIFALDGMTLSGNLGSDHFVCFASKGQRSVITDFDANGGGLEQDYLFFFDESPEGRDYTVFERGDDLVFKLEDAGQVILRDVDRAEFDLGDLKTPPPDLFA